ncbi:MAG: hypothetical protein J7621_17845 [Niastella sp.]|nr:hypothetical protein [Niastella sp.]
MKRLIEILRQTDHDSIWGVAIKNTFGGAYEVEDLIRELKMQCHDCPYCMSTVIGDEAVTLLLQL